MENMDCMTWLKIQLTDKESHLCEEVRSSAKRQGYTKADLKDARKVLGVKTFHQFDEDGATPNYFWCLED